MTNPEDQQNQSLLHSMIESPESLSEEELETIGGGVSTLLKPLLRRALSDSDLPRLAQLHPHGINHAPPARSSSSSSSSSGDLGGFDSPDHVTDRYDQTYRNVRRRS